MSAPSRPKWVWPIPDIKIGVPKGNDPAAFGVQRKHHWHEGVDLHCEIGTWVYPVEPGVVVHIGPFTGKALGHDWWLDTFAVMVEGTSGLVVYGEIYPIDYLAVGSNVDPNDPLGQVIPVLPPKLRRWPSMLHLELRKPGSTRLFDWTSGERPDWLLDPTPYLEEALADVRKSDPA